MTVIACPCRLIKEKSTSGRKISTDDCSTKNSITVSIVPALQITKVMKMIIIKHRMKNLVLQMKFYLAELAWDRDYRVVYFGITTISCYQKSIHRKLVRSGYHWQSDSTLTGQMDQYFTGQWSWKDFAYSPQPHQPGLFTWGEAGAFYQEIRNG